MITDEPFEKPHADGRNTKHIARVGLFCTLCLVFVGSLFGRRIQLALPGLVPFLPVVALLLILGGSAYALRLGRAGFRLPPFSRDFCKVSLLSLLLPMLMIWTCEQLIVAPIERMHFFKFAALSCFSFFAQRGCTRRRFVKAFIFAAAIGCLEETAQRYTPDRVFDPRDMLLNVVAAFFGAVYSALVMLWKPFLHLSEKEEKGGISAVQRGKNLSGCD